MNAANNRRAVIVSAVSSAPLSAFYAPESGDYVICADGGYRLARQAGLRVDLLIGDFDSLDEVPASVKAECVPSEKDDTDAMLCVKRALQLGYTRLIMLGGLVGRFDHSYANVQAMRYALDQGAELAVVDGKNELHMLSPGRYQLARKNAPMLSLFAYSPVVEGLCIRGVKYPLHQHLLTNADPLGVSNEFLSSEAEVEFASGQLLVIYSED